LQTWVNPCICKAIVSRAKATNSTIALEDLTGIGERVNQPPRSKTERRRSNSWAFYQLRQFVHYKALRAGVKVVVVPPAYTSQICHQCLWIGQREGKRFRCVNPACSWEGDADYNAALASAKRSAYVIALLGAAVNRPPYIPPPPVYGGQSEPGSLQLLAAVNPL